MANKLDEEEILRDHLLSVLNSLWEGQASGEVFNGDGKTDILIRANNGNVFIGECKFWDGAKTITAGLDQLFDKYLVWRDTKAALVVFIKRKNVTQILEKLHDAIEAHPQWAETITAQDPERRRDYIFRARDDQHAESNSLCCL